MVKAAEDVVVDIATVFWDSRKTYEKSPFLLPKKSQEFVKALKANTGSGGCEKHMVPVGCLGDPNGLDWRCKLPLAWAPVTLDF